MKRQLLPKHRRMYVGVKTIPTMNQVNTCHIINRAKMLAIPAACHTRTVGRTSAVKVIVSEVATKLAGTRKAHTVIQLARENSVKVLKSNISSPG